MASHLYSQQIKNLVQGISQQPSFIRYPEQLDAQVNGFSTEVDGLQKRPPTIFQTILQELRLGEAKNMLAHFVYRDESEQYMMVFTNKQIYVYDLDGQKHNVTYDGSASQYIETLDPQKDLQVLTVADYTFVLNKTKVTAMSSTRSPDNSKQGTLIVVKSGQYGNTYSANGQSYTTPNGDKTEHVQNIKVEFIARQLASQIGNGAWASHNFIWVSSAWGVSDSYGGAAMLAISNEVQKFSDLPYYAPNNFTVKIKGDPNDSGAGSYYVKYNEANNTWVECPAPNIPIEIDKNTMPHGLVRNADGTFTFKTLDWDNREVGDDISNPQPSFIGFPLSSIFFYRNRLGVSSKENIILSESGNYWNWWMTTANDLLDTDCIDVPVTSTKVNLINYMVVYMEDLYAFSADTQFIMRSDTAMSPKTASPVEITQFNSSPSCQPVVTGKNMYFATERGKFASIKEYYTLQDVSAMKNAQDISSHVPNYIPAGVYKIIASTTENILLFLTKGEPKSIYVYKFLFDDTQRVQSAWSKWTFDGIIHGCGFIANTLYLLIQRGTTFTLEYIDFSTSILDFEDEPFRVFLDMKTRINNGVYDDLKEVTTFNIREAYGLADDSPWTNNKVDVVSAEGVYYPARSIKNGVFTMDGDWRNKVLFVGLPYTFHITFSTFYLKDNQNGSTTSRAEGRTQVKYINLQYDHSGYFEANVHQTGGRDFSYKMTSEMLGTTAQLGVKRDDTGIFRFPVHAKNDEVTISIDSGFPVALALVGLTWECLYMTKTRRV